MRVIDALRRLFRSSRASTLVAGVVAGLVALSAGVGLLFFADAAMYWNGASALVDGGDVTIEGGLALRGVWSSVIFLPAAASASVFGPEAAGLAVLIQNALLVAVIGSVVLPRLVARMTTPRIWHIWVSAVTVAVIARGAVPYPLMDLWAAAAAFVGILLISSSRWYVCMAGGLAAVIAVNLRPAYLVPLALVAVVWCIFNARRMQWPALGAAIGLVPQVLFNRYAFDVWLPWPVDTFRIGQIQAQYSGYVVRYDTVLYSPVADPRLFSCDPAMARAMLDSTSDGLFAAIVRDPIHAIPFALEKLTASLQWSFATPYASASISGVNLIGLIVTIVSVAGVVGLIRHAFRSGVRRTEPMGAQLAGLWLGTAATLVASTPEARFALPLVLSGIIGTIVFVSDRLEYGWQLRREWAWTALIAVFVIVTIIVGQIGLSQPAGPGNATVEVCASV